MRLALDKHADLDSPVHRWDPRFKIVGLFALAFSFALVEDLILLPAMLAISAGLCLLSRLPIKFVRSRLRYPGVFVLFLAVMLPLFSGETALFGVGPVELREEGTLAFALILCRFVSIVLVGLVIFGTATMHTNVEAMRALELPAILADMTLFSYRYLDELGDTLTKMRRATKLRGFEGGRKTPEILSSLVGSLLVRSHERSGRVYHAMVLRGYGIEKKRGHGFKARRADVAGLVSTLLLAAAFVIAQVVLS
ncbi:MAG: cobalt ECF transporter T component CbiQ [Rubrobacteraceae bacterium]